MKLFWGGLAILVLGLLTGFYAATLIFFGFGT